MEEAMEHPNPQADTGLLGVVTEVVADQVMVLQTLDTEHLLAPVDTAAAVVVMAVVTEVDMVVETVAEVVVMVVEILVDTVVEVVVVMAVQLSLHQVATDPHQVVMDFRPTDLLSPHMDHQEGLYLQVLDMDLHHREGTQVVEV